MTGSALISAISNRAQGSILQAHLFNLTSIIRELVPFSSPGTQTRVEHEACRPYILGVRGEAARQLIYVPVRIPAIPSATHYTLSVPTSLSAEMLQRQFSIYGIERIPPAGGAASALSRQEQVNSRAGDLSSAWL